MSKRKITLVYSDVDFGCDEFGYIQRNSSEDPDEEDLRYERHVEDRTDQYPVRVVAGHLFIG